MLDFVLDVGMDKIYRGNVVMMVSGEDLTEEPMLCDVRNIRDKKYA